MTPFSNSFLHLQLSLHPILINKRVKAVSFPFSKCLKKKLLEFNYNEARP